YHICDCFFVFFFSSRRRHTRWPRDWSSDVCSSDLLAFAGPWKRKGDWWSETAWAREEWDIEIRTLRPKVRAELSGNGENETALYRVYKDLRAKRWFVEGIYD